MSQSLPLTTGYVFTKLMAQNRYTKLFFENVLPSGWQQQCNAPQLRIPVRTCFYTEDVCLIIFDCKSLLAGKHQGWILLSAGYLCSIDKHVLATVNSWQMFPAAISCMMFLSENHRLGIHGFADWDLSVRPFAWVCWLKYTVQEHGYKWKCWMQNVQNTFSYQNPMLCFRQPSILPVLTIANYKNGLAY